MSFGNDGLDAQEECGVTGNHLSIGISADVTDVGIGDSAGIHQLLELHAGDNAGDVTGLIGVGEHILQVAQTGNGSGIAGAGHEGDVGIFLGNRLHVGLMAIGVGEDDGAALFCQIHNGIGTELVLRDVVSENDLGINVNAQLFAGSGQAVDVSHVITGVGVMDTDQTDLHSGLFSHFGALVSGCLFLFSGIAAAAAGDQAQRHDQSQNECKELLHAKFPPSK